MAVWLERRDVDYFHGELLEQYGGLPGPPDEDALESTLARPQQLLNYEPDSTLFELAAAYGYGFARNHCFPDGNKRVALAAMDIFLSINGFELEPDEVDAVVILNEVAADEISRSELSEWLEANSRPLADSEI